MNTALRVLSRSDLNPGCRKNYINEANRLEPKTGVLFVDFIEKTIIRKARRHGGSLKSNYANVSYHIERFADINNVDIFTNSINEEFLDDFIFYLEGQNERLNYIQALITYTKTLVRWAAIYGYAIDPTFDNVKLELEETFSVYLSTSEITRIYYFKGLSKKQEQIKDLFVVGCLTALRYSDYSTLSKDNFIGDEIVKVTKKTNTKVIIPVHDYVREIYAKYDHSIPGGLTNQHFNRYIQKICQLIGFNEPVTYSYTKGGKLVTETKEKWQMISSHTARRSAATNMYLTGRWKTFQIMAITGHTTEESFFKYIKITKTDVAKQMAGDTYFKK